MSKDKLPMPHDDDDETDQIRRALGSMDSHAAPVDQDALQSIRERAQTVVKGRVKVTRLPHSADTPTRRSMPRAVATLASTLVLLLVVVFLKPSAAKEVASLGELLSKLRSANSVSMRVTRSAETQHIQLRAPGTVRWSEDERHYRIADGHRLWQVDLDGADQMASVSEQPSPIPAEGTNALALLGIEAMSDADLRRVYPTRETKRDGIVCLQYESPVAYENKAARLVAFADRQTGRLTAFRVQDASQAVLAEVQLQETDATAQADAFRVHKSLRDDGRVGTLAEVHGLVFVRSFPGHRWTLASNSMPLFAGDQVRCAARGANAAVLRLSSGITLTLGPAAQLGLRPDSKLQLQTGDVQIQLAGAANQQAGKQVTVIGPGEQESTLKESAVLRARSSPPELSVLDIVPPWLVTLQGNLTTETLGSLVAQVDGRDVSLALGFHHVSVDIRNQIARTVIEESFVNNTSERLEGVFHFPLPHDASISGFGMWIGGQLVEADIVEKQRAREIYETILREKRDPGLLEWAGGNIFKARVFPIEAHSEKKIRITYTQTLPLQDSSFRYAYALRSELLQQTPLRDLTIDVTLHSAVPLREVTSPSHPLADVQTTRNSASVHYSSQDVTPDRDFEMLCTLDGHQQDVVAIPHIRGDDGYMMIQFSPPSVSAGNWSRTLVRDGEPLDVILLCDTSRSMDSFARQQQAELVSGVLGCLSESDRVRLACCDVECEWLQPTAVGVTSDLRQALQQKLEQRRSLGWSNLPLALAEVLQRADTSTQVIYIGDGTVVNEFTEAGARGSVWLKGLAAHPQPAPTFHGVAVGNTFDMNMIRAIGRVGRGTSRSVAGSESPIATARQLLLEITRPGLRDLQVEFRNVQVAAVYPRELPNLADGMQHILTGRFRPGQHDADAQIVVTGKRGDELVRYVARMPLDIPTRSSDQPDQAAHSETDNSFIPRLWAKAHLDQLLQEANTPDVVSRITKLSQQYHLMTPYTSLLVLDSDADRKRFGVERSLQMRDGEEFFAAGRREAEYSLRQQQLAEAKLYRQQLYKLYRDRIKKLVSAAVPLQGIRTLDGRRLGRRKATTFNVYSYYFSPNYPTFGRGVPALSNFTIRNGAQNTFDVDNDGDSVWFGDVNGAQLEGRRVFSRQIEDSGFLFGRGEPLADFDRLSRFSSGWGWSDPLIGDDFGVEPGFPFMPEFDVNVHDIDTTSLITSLAQPQFQNLDRKSVGEIRDPYGAEALGRTGAPTIFVEPPTFGISDVLPVIRSSDPAYAPWPKDVAPLFPAVRHTSAAPEDEVQTEYPDSDWPDQVTSLLRSMEQSFAQLNQGLKFRSRVKTSHPVNGSIVSSTDQRLDWAASLGWLREAQTDRGILWQWSLDGHSGTYLPAFRTGRIAQHPQPPKRAASELSFPGADALMIERTQSSDWSAELRDDNAGRATILLTHRTSPSRQRRITFDKERRCVLKDESMIDGMVTSAVRYDDHVQVESLWLPQSVKTLVYESIVERLAEVTQASLTWSTVPTEQLRQQLLAQVELAKNGLLIKGSLPTKAQATEAISTGTANFEHKLARVFEWVSQARWAEVLPMLDKTLAEHGQVQNGHWLRWAILLQSTHQQQLRQELPSMLPNDLQAWEIWPAKADADRNSSAVAVLRSLDHFCEILMSPNDYVGALKTINAELRNAAADRETQFYFMNHLAGQLKQLQRAEESMQLRRAFAKLWPDFFKASKTLIDELKHAGSPDDIQQAYELLLADNQKWSAAEWNAGFLAYVTWLRAQGEFAAGQRSCERWTKRCPFAANAWEHTLRSLLERDRPDEVRRLRNQWLAAVLADDVDAAAIIPPVMNAQFHAAFHFGFGQMAGLNLAGPEQEIRTEMLAVAEKFVRADRHLSVANRVMTDKRFSKEPDGQALMKRMLSTVATALSETPADGSSFSNLQLQTILTWLQNSGVSGCDEHEAVLLSMRKTLDQRVGELTPAELSLLLFTWGTGFDEGTPKAQSQEWLDAIVKRWQAAEKPFDRDLWAALIRRFEQTTFDKSHQLLWFRRQYAECRPERRAAAAHELFTALLTQTWNPKTESEAWNLIDVVLNQEVGVEEDADTTERDSTLQLLQRISLVRTWTSGMLTARMALMQDADKKWNDLNVRQKQLLQRNFRVKTLRGLIKVLNSHITTAARSEPQQQPTLLRLSSWLTMHRLTLQRQLSHADVVAGVTDEQRNSLKLAMLNDIRRLLPQAPEQTPDPNDQERSQGQRYSDTAQLNARHWLFSHWLQLAQERDDETDSQHIDEILAYVRKGASTDTIAPRAWRAAEFGILVANDRPQELQERLKLWVHDDLATAPWRRHLGHLLAELDRLDEAVALYETAARSDLLSAADWKLLSVWQHALDRRADHEESLWQEWKRIPVSEKHARLQQQLSAWHQNTATRTPTAPTGVIRQLSELLRTTTADNESLNLVKRWYVSTNDPLLLQAVGSYVTGRSRSGMLQSVKSTQSLVNKVEQEAGIDMIYASVAAAAQQIAADTSRSPEQQDIDRIGLKIFELQAAARAARILNQPGPHADRAIIALDILKDVVWQDDEKPLFAERLDHLGVVPDRRLRTLRFDAALKLLENCEQPHRLQAALPCVSIAKRDQQVDRAVELLESEFRLHLATADSYSGPAATALGKLADEYRQQKRFLAAEQLLSDSAQSLNASQLENGIWTTRVTALREGGRTLVGEGSELYIALRDSVWNDVVKPPQPSRFQLAWDRLQQVFHAANIAGIPELRDDASKLAGFVDPLIRRHSGQHADIMGRLETYLRTYVGHREAAEFLLERLRSQPVALQWTEPRSVWNHFGDTLYNMTWPRPEDKDQPRKLRPSLRPLRQQIEQALLAGFETGLMHRDAVQQILFDRHRCTVFRNGKRRVLDAVERTFQAHKNSEPHLIFLVDFLTKQFEDQTGTAIGYLQQAFAQGLLNHTNQRRLVDLQFKAGQYADGVAVLRTMTQSDANSLDLRFRLMTGYFHLGDTASLVKELEYITENLVDPQKASTSQVFKVANHCRECQLWQHSVDLYQQALDRRGWPTGTDQGLSTVWNNQAECLMMLDRTNEALDAVSAAWVVCGRSRQHRQQAKARLDQILAEVTDLNNASQHIAKRATETGEESSFLRRALGKAFLEAQRSAEAEEHLQIALELQPADPETRATLIAAFDQQQKSAAAIAALIDQLEFGVRNIPVYKDLASRFQKLQQPRQAERAATSIVEVAVEEAAHHAALAELREDNNNLPAAIEHWKRAVDLKTEDPTALMRLTRAYLRAKQKPAARRTFERLQQVEWHKRFKKLPAQMQELRRMLRN